MFQIPSPQEILRYLVAQSLYKVVPSFDRAVLGILARDKGAHFERTKSAKSYCWWLNAHIDHQACQVPKMEESSPNIYI